MKGKYILTFLSALLGMACESGSIQHKEQTTDADSIRNVQQSHANIDEVAADSLSLSLRVNFVDERLEGSATWFIRPGKDVSEWVLDVRSMDIHSVTVDNHEVPFTLSEDHPIYGQALKIPITGSSAKVTISYQTKRGAEALQWMSGQQTAGGKPFLYTQSQAILARSWVPCMDLPANRFTYSASVFCEAPYRPLMGADNPEKPDSAGWYHFSMDQPIPSYLLALAAGELEFRAYDGRCGVYAEPVVMEKAFNELQDLPKMIEAAEGLYGEYRWGRYDVLFLPPSFPFGGMENPKLTFATPTILAGDRSLVALVAHELAHSWSGNLVTNRTWNDFWLNEGFTVYFEQRIMEAVYGKEYADMLTVLGYQDLKATLEEMGDTNPDTRLYLDLSGRDPDEGVSDIAYEKGRFFLRHLEELVGRARFDAFLKTYFNAHAFQTMDTKEFINYLNVTLLYENAAWKEKAKIDEWIYQPGLPADFEPPRAEAFDRVDDYAERLKQGEKGAVQLSKNFTTHHWLHFIRGIEAPADTALLMRLERLYHFSTANAEIANRWFILSVESNWQQKVPQIESFLMEVGRRKFLTPLYGAMKESSPYWQNEALRIYKKARQGYHAVSIHTLDELLEFHP
ncbi:MAG: M1 family metallopeptidase [Bacteroidia bacterium]